MNAVRLNITLPHDISSRLKPLVSPRKRSQFIAAAVQQKIRKIEQIALQKQLEEGCAARREESLKITEEFENSDLEG